MPKTVKLWNKAGFHLFTIVICLIIVASSFLACAPGAGKGLTINLKNRDGSETEITIGLPFIQAKDRLQEWQYPKTIAVPLNINSGPNTSTLGDLAKDGVSIVIPGKSFDTPNTVTMKSPDKVPPMYSRRFEPLGTPVEITSSSQRRTNYPVVVNMQVKDKERYTDDLKRNNIWVAYYDGKQWDYFMPDKTNVQNGTITFETYHFSFFGYGKIPLEQRIEEYTHSKTLASMTQKKVDDVFNKAVEQVVDHVLKEKLGLDEDSAKYKIISSLANDDEYKDIIDKFCDGDITGGHQDFMVFLGKKIAENLPEGFAKSLKGKALGSITSEKGVGYAEAISKAAGYAVEGKYLEAGKIIGEKIADGFLVTKFTKIATEVAQYQINTWKDREIEAAYKAYKNGADGIFWGYNVDAGDFQSLYNQMRGIATRLEQEAVKHEINRRKELGMRPPTNAELNSIRNQVRKDLEEKFKQRAKEEAKIEKEKAILSKLIKAYKDAKLIEPGHYGYEDFVNIEYRLDRLIAMRDKILRDTGRKGWNFSLFSNDKEICIGDILELTKAWYTKNGEQEYARLIKKKFGIDITKKPVETAKTDKKKSVVDIAKDTIKNIIPSSTGKASSEQKSPTPSGGGGSLSGTFPAAAFNGMQINYSIGGATSTSQKDQDGFTTSRAITGKLGSGNLTVSGSCLMGGGFGADIVVTVSVDGNTKQFKDYVKSGYPGFNSKSFNLTVPIPKDAKSGSVSINMTGHYNVGTRGLVVSGTFSR